MSQALLLAGPPGAGKTTVARALAQRLGLRALDLDELVEARAGRSPAEVIERDGEERFRALEAEALDALGRGGAVISLGGGALTRRRSRETARRLGPIVGLDVPPSVLESRLSHDAAPRPLLANGLGDLLEARAASYAAVDTVVDGVGPPEAVAERVEARVRDLTLLESRFMESSSRILVGRELESAIAGAVAHIAPSRPILLLRDEGVPRPKRERLEARLSKLAPLYTLDLPGGEAVKTWDQLGAVLTRALEAGCGRQSVVVGLGGGALCDLTGMVAHLLGRGARSVLVPTTLLAQVDASVGAKCAVNLAGVRNPVGAFQVPTDVIIDIGWLDSLPPEVYRSGLAELVKMAVIGLPEVFDQLERGDEVSANMVAASVELKAKIVARDPVEQGERRTLNLGHTLGHALESASGFELRHGEGVAIGLAAAARASIAAAALDPAIARRIEGLLERRGLPIRAPAPLLQSARTFFANDKKGDARTLEWVLIRALGEVMTERRPLEEVRDTLVALGG